MGLLENIDSPQDLKRLSRSELPELAREIRQSIVNVVSESGGHLASSLGVVELTIALHRVFDTPADRILWAWLATEYSARHWSTRRRACI